MYNRRLIRCLTTPQHGPPTGVLPCGTPLQGLLRACFIPLSEQVLHQWRPPSPLTTQHFRSKNLKHVLTRNDVAASPSEVPHLTRPFSFRPKTSCRPHIFHPSHSIKPSACSKTTMPPTRRFLHFHPRIEPIKHPNPIWSKLDIRPLVLLDRKSVV